MKSIKSTKKFINKKGIIILLSLCLCCMAFTVSAAPEETQYTVIAPKVLYKGGEASITIITTDENKSFVNRTVKVFLNSYELLTVSTNGQITVPFTVPDDMDANATLTITSLYDNKTINASVKVKDSSAVFIETDKPIYKPGQVIHGRVLAVNKDLKPIEKNIIVEIKDAKGIKIFKKYIKTDNFGVASFDLPLADELNFGTWKITAEIENSLPQVKETLDVEVEKYVLPKFKIDAELPKNWFLVSEPITGVVNANYFFGKPVEGSITIEAYRYIGMWDNYATFNAEISKEDEGKKEFELPAVGYVSGTPNNGGQGNLMLNISVADTGGHVETTTKLLKITQTDMILQLISDSNAIKPKLPFQLLVVTKDPDGNPLDKEVNLTIKYKEGKTGIVNSTKLTIYTKNGINLTTIYAPENTTGVLITANSGSTVTKLPIETAYSPTSSFIHIIQTSSGIPGIGDTVSFDVYATNKAPVYYDIFGGGRTIFSGVTENNKIEFIITPEMARNSNMKVVAYQINPNNEVSADTLPFKIETGLPVDLTSSFSENITNPGSNVNISFNVNYKIQSAIGVSIVDESVYALSEGRLNLKQIFDELERIFMETRAEAHPKIDWYGLPYETKGPKEILDDAGVQIISSENLIIPEGETFYERIGECFDGICIVFAMAPEMKVGAVIALPESPEGLKEPERVRQFFPETWYWNPSLLTDNSGEVKINLTVPDSITTWRLNAVSSSDKGIGMSNSRLIVFQDFFVDPDIPYSVTRGEEFPIKIAVYNYLNISQNVYLELEEGDWFELFDSKLKNITIDANSVNSVSFKVKPAKVGVKTFKITGRTVERADAVKKTIIVEPEGTPLETVKNGVLDANNPEVEINVSFPDNVVLDSGKVFASITPSLVGQTINGVEDLLHMPYGCGEQNMIFFAPDVEILRYLKATDQLNPEISAKSEVFINTGYQRELTFQRQDGSFSAFGDSDKEGSLWLTSFVLLTFSSARDIKEIDENVLYRTAKWLEEHQNTDGSWDHIGFLHHQDMKGSLSGKYALTAFTALSLIEYGSSPSIEKARNYLENHLDDENVSNNEYALAIGTLALKKMNSSRANDAVNKLLQFNTNTNVETSAYKALALMEFPEQKGKASEILKWISAQRNSRGGFTTTQNTVVAFKALIKAAILQNRDINADLTILADGIEFKRLTVTEENFDVLQIVEIQNASTVKLILNGSGEVNYQIVKKFNILMPPPPPNAIELNVEYDAEGIETNDMINVTVKVKYMGVGNSTGMLLIDVAVPTGFSAVAQSLDDLLNSKKISRYDIAGRKVIIYVDDLPRGEELTLKFKMLCNFPVKAIIPDSTAYAYYNPNINAKVFGGDRLAVFPEFVLAKSDVDATITIMDGKIKINWSDLNGTLHYEIYAGEKNEFDFKVPYAVVNETHWEENLSNEKRYYAIKAVKKATGVVSVFNTDLIKIEKNKIIGQFNIVLIKKPGDTGLNSIGVPFNSTIKTAKDLMESIEGCDYVARWDPKTQEYVGYPAGTPEEYNFELGYGEAYFISVNESTTWFSAGFMQVPQPMEMFKIENDTGLNLIRLPIDSSIKTAKELLESIDGCDYVSAWNAESQEYVGYPAGAPEDMDFDLEPGKGYFVSVRGNVMLDSF